MCNINVIYNKQKKSSKLLTEFMKSASFMSYQHNSHGDGYLGIKEKSFVTQKDVDKLDYMGRFYFLASHQRLATSGKRDVANAHPYVKGDLVLMHNGMFYGLGDNSESDTKKYLDLLEKRWRKTKNMVKAIQQTTKGVGGRYSVLVYNKKEDKVYYFKEDTTSMYLVQDKTWLIMSTEETNVEFARYFLGIGHDIKKVKHKIIYDVMDNMRHLGRFKESYEYPTKEKTKPASTEIVISHQRGLENYTHTNMLGLPLLSKEEHQLKRDIQKYMSFNRDTLDDYDEFGEEIKVLSDEDKHALVDECVQYQENRKMGCWHCKHNFLKKEMSYCVDENFYIEMYCPKCNKPVLSYKDFIQYMGKAYEIKGSNTTHYRGESKMTVYQNHPPTKQDKVGVFPPALDDLSREGVIRAMVEYQLMGFDEFSKNYMVNSAKEFREEIAKLKVMWRIKKDEVEKEEKALQKLGYAS